MPTVTEEEIEAFLSSLRASDVDKKVNLIQLWGMKLEELDELPTRSIDAITLLISPLIRSPSHLLATSTLSSFLPYFLPLIPASRDHSHLRVAVLTLLPPLLEKLNDPKDRVHGPAGDCISLLGVKCYEAESGSQPAPSAKGKERDTPASVWEATIKEALEGRGVRVKLEVLRILLKLRTEGEVKLPLKPWLPSLVALLEDSDGSVRDSARETVVAMLSPPSTPAAARSELKKLMLARGVRKSISESIMARVFGGAGAAGISTPSRTGAQTPAPSGPAASQSDGPTIPGDAVDVVYIASARDLDNEFRAMIPHFAGKETEHNWGQRERSLLRVRGMLRGKAFEKQPEAFLQGLKNGLIEGLVKTLMSLRTTVAQQSCALVQELAETLGPSFDPSLDYLLPTLGKMAGLTKRIIAERSQKAVTAILTHASPAPSKLIGHIAAGVQDKSVQARQYGAAHLKTYLETQAKDNRGLVEGTPGALEHIQHLLRKCLADTNPLVREQGRLAFWTFETLWPDQASVLTASLDGPARRQLEKANPRTGTTPVSSRTSKPRTPRSSAMSALLAAKRAQAAELAAKRIAAGDDPGQPMIEALPIDHATNRTPRSPSSAPSEGTVTPRRSSESPTPGIVSPRVVRPLRSSQSPKVSGSEKNMVEDSTAVASECSIIEPTRANLDKSPSDVPCDGSRPCTPLSRSDHMDDYAFEADDDHLLQETNKSNSLAVPSRQTPRTKIHRSGIPVRSPPRIGSSPSSARPRSVPRSSLTSSQSMASNLSRTVSRSPTPRVDPESIALLESETPSKFTRSSSFQARFPLREMRRLSNTPISDVATTSMEHLPNSPADEQIRAQAAQAFSAAQQLLDFDDDQDAMSDIPYTPIKHSAKPPMSLVYRTPSSGIEGMARQPWEDSPKPLTPKLLKALQSRGYERSWWTERRKLLDQMASLKQSLPSDGHDVERAVEGLSLGDPSISDLQVIALYCAAHPVSSTDAPFGDDTADTRDLWSRTRLFDRVFEGLIHLLRPETPADILEQGIVTLWELVQYQWPLCEDREDALLDVLFQLRTSCNSMVLEAANAMLSLLTEVCDPPFLLSLLHTALDRFIATVKNEAVASSNDRISGERAAAAGYSFGLNAMGMCILHLPLEAVEVEAKQLAGPVMEALRLDSSSAVMARQAAHRVILAVQCVIADDVRTLALFPRLTPGQRSFATYLMQQNGVMGRAGDELEADARRQTVLNELVEGLAKGIRTL